MQQALHRAWESVGLPGRAKGTGRAAGLHEAGLTGEEEAGRRAAVASGPWCALLSNGDDNRAQLWQVMRGVRQELLA